MLQKIEVIWIFYRKSFFPALISALLLGAMSMTLTKANVFSTVGWIFFPMVIFFHVIHYEIQKPGAYYFFYNLGFNKLQLWGISLSLNLLITLMLIL